MKIIPIQEELNEILDLHEKWLRGEPNGKQADLSNKDLSFLNLSGRDLRYINLKGSNLKGADLCGADLRFADLSNTDLSFANLSCTDLRYINLNGASLSRANLYAANLYSADLRSTNLEDADLSYINLSFGDLRGANLSCADLRGTDLSFANLRGANLRYTDLRGAYLRYVSLIDVDLNGSTCMDLVCPKEGSFIGYKKLKDEYERFAICKLEIPPDAKRLSATTRKCRCSKAKVLEILAKDNKGNYTIPTNEGYSIYGKKNGMEFKYVVGEYVYPDEWDDNRWNECSGGIHFFMTKEEAIDY